MASLPLHCEVYVGVLFVDVLFNKRAGVFYRV